MAEPYIHSSTVRFVFTRRPATHAVLRDGQECPSSLPALRGAPHSFFEKWRYPHRKTGLIPLERHHKPGRFAPRAAGPACCRLAAISHFRYISFEEHVYVPEDR